LSVSLEILPLPVSCIAERFASESRVTSVGAAETTGAFAFVNPALTLAELSACVLKITNGTVIAPIAIKSTTVKKALFVLIFLIPLRRNRLLVKRILDCAFRTALLRVSTGAFLEQMNLPVLLTIGNLLLSSFFRTVLKLIL